jgi:glycosyltransferase involved in cell wall biosynthesis
MTAPFHPCVLVPTFDNPATIEQVVVAVREQIRDVIVIDDGSGEPGRRTVDDLGRRQLAHVVRREENGGKGAAVKTGFEVARSLGYSHVLQVDADGQHDLADVGHFLETARQNPQALVLGSPLFDASAPRGRLIGRQITRFWTTIETGGRAITDPMCGFRVYPLAAALKASRGTGDRMDFDIEIAVRMVWDGVATLNLPTRVRYFEGGLSHFHLLHDNVRISWMHTRLVVRAILRLLLRPLRGLTKRRSK